MDLYGGPYKELAEHCGVCSATIASVVRKLEAFGIVKETPSISGSALCNRMKVWLSE